ncbi:ion transporter [bacterium]|nr:ion transporter [bacterium]MBU1991360.1 ion transporter [bacterium]
MIVNGAYYINTSDAYQKKKTFFYNLLENDTYSYKKYFDLVMITLVFISVAILIREVKSHVNDYLLVFNNIIISIIFLIEYLLRLWISSSVTQVIINQSENDDLLGKKFNLLRAFAEIVRIKFQYIRSFRAIIDLLAVIPFFHQFRLLRIFILFRVFKLFRYARSLQMFISILATKKFEFLTIMIFALIVIAISSILIYVMEANNPNSPIDTLYEAVYWSIVTISTVGYGDITAVTDAGRFVAMGVIIAGIAVLAFTTSIVVSAFTEKIDDIKVTKSIDDLEKLKNIYIICGYENISKEVAKILVGANNKVIVLDEDAQRAKNALEDGLSAFNYDPGSVESYKKLRIDIDTQVKAVLCLRESDVENVYTILTVRSIHKEVFILSLLMNEIHRKKMSFAGANEILYTKQLVGMIAREFVGQPVAFEVIHALMSEYSNIDIEEIVVTQRMLNNFVMVKELNNAKYRVVLLGIYKKNTKRFFFNPLDDSILEEGDFLLVVGNSVFIKEFEKYLYKKTIV